MLDFYLLYCVQFGSFHLKMYIGELKQVMKRATEVIRQLEEGLGKEMIAFRTLEANILVNVLPLFVGIQNNINL